MNKESIRDVCYIVQLFTPPNTNYVKDDLQELYSSTAKTHDYSRSLIRDDGSAEFAITDQKSPEITKYFFNRNVITLIHDKVNKIGIGLFIKNAEDILEHAIQKLRIPIFVQQNFIIRCTADPLKINDSRIFLSEKVCSIERNRYDLFNRPLHGIGLRLFFPPTQDKPYQFDVKIESLLVNPKLLFLECKGVFFQPIQKGTLNLIEKNIMETRNFIYSNMANFLIQFNENREAK